MRVGWEMDLTGAGVLPLPVFVSRPSISAYEQIVLRFMEVGRAAWSDWAGGDPRGVMTVTVHRLAKRAREIRKGSHHGHPSGACAESGPPTKVRVVRGQMPYFTARHKR